MDGASGGHAVAIISSAVDWSETATEAEGFLSPVPRFELRGRRETTIVGILTFHEPLLCFRYMPSTTAAASGI